MKHSQGAAKLSKFLAYILGRHPDEFGLLPDEHGYVKIKDLMKVLAEEPGWRHVRLNQVSEVVHRARSATIEMDKDRIRAVDRTHLFLPEIPETVPKLLYYPLRQRAYPLVLEKGLRAPAHGNRLVLADNLQLASRLGKRIDPAAVILTVNTSQAYKHGATIWCFGQHMFLFDCLPLGCFSGPPLPKNRPPLKKAALPDPETLPKTPGSYLIGLTDEPLKESRAAKGRRGRKNEWKRERKKRSRFNTFLGGKR